MRTTLVAIFVGLAGVASADQEPIRVGRGVPEPTPTHMELARYPVGASGSAFVFLDCTIDTEGKVTRVDILERRQVGFDGAVEEAVRKWVFSPSQLNGKPVPVSMTMVLFLAPPRHEPGNVWAPAMDRGPWVRDPFHPALKSANELVRSAAVKQLGDLLGKRALKDLRDALADPSPLVRQAAAEALGKLGSKARKAAPDLRKAMEDPDEYVRSASQGALDAMSR